MKKLSFLTLFGLVLLVIVGSYTAYSFWQKSAVQSELDGVKANVSMLQQEVMVYEDKEVVSAMNAKRVLPKLKEGTLLWSKVLRDIDQVIPKHGGKKIVDMLSYSGSFGRDLSFSIKTASGSEDPYLAVADLIEAFDDSNIFSDVFVPSLSAGNDEEGRSVLTFSLSTKYTGENVSDLLNSIEPEEDTKTSTSNKPITR